MIIEADELLHYGVLRRSGRYPWGSGDNETQRSKDWLSYVQGLRDDGLSDNEIAEGMGMTITQFREERTISRAASKQADVAEAHRLKYEEGLSNSAAARKMGIPEPTFRTLIAPGAKDKADNLERIATEIKKAVDDQSIVDVGSGVSTQMGITETKFKSGLALAQRDGYKIYYFKEPQLGTIHKTNMKVMVKPETEWSEAKKMLPELGQITSFSNDGGRKFGSIHPPISVNPKRVQVIYGKEGAKADGVIYVRPDVDDISLGGVKYSQVRVLVGKDRFLKGMAIYKNDLPDGVDLQFHTNKDDTGNKLDAMKKLTEDPDLPFGSLISKQILADPDTPKERVTSVMNIVNEQGDWAKWSKTLSSQMLSKQSRILAKQQLDMTFERRMQRYEDIMALTNPTVRKKLLQEFSEGTDSASVHLKAASMPGQSVHVILPLSTIKPNEVFAPQHINGDVVVLVRHPHGGTFEIPRLTVNNRNAEGKRLLGKDSVDAIGIHHEVAQRLSGADFDGDTVLVIPNNTGRIKVTQALEGLKDFDPRAAYPKYEGMKPIGNMQTEMGKISNLITDMTIRNASSHEITRAIKHSMVVIDSEKHELNYKQSELDNNIKDLRNKYQRDVPGGTKRGAASTLISRAKSEESVNERILRRAREGGPIDPITGKLVYTPTGRVLPSGKLARTRSTKLKEAEDAFMLSSGTPMEAVYAVHSNKLKALANQARLDYLHTPRLEKSSSAAKTYAKEVDSLKASLNLAKKNQPLERRAQAIGNAAYKAKLDYNPTMDKAMKKKVKAQCLDIARTRVGAHKHKIKISQEEWNAIQAGAISDTMLTEILNNADMKVVNDLATPPKSLLMTPTKKTRADSMIALGYTRTEIAEALGVSLSTLDAATS